MALTWVDITHPDDLAENLRLFDRALSGEGDGAYTMDKRFVRKDGETIHTSISAQCVRRPDGAPDYIIVLVQNLTERKRAEEALRVSEQNYRALFENAAAGIGRSRITDGKVLLANRKLAQIFGYERVEQFVAEFSFVDHYVDPGERERLIALYKKGSDKPVEVSFTKRDGSVVTVANQGWVDEKAAHIDFVMTDITERKRAEAALSESGERLRAWMDNSHTPITLKDMEGRYLLANKRFGERFNVNGEEIVGKTAYDIWPPEYADEISAHDRKVLETGTATERETQTPLPDGTTRTTIMHKFPIIRPDGGYTGVGTIEIDITERKQAEKALRGSEERLRLLLETTSAIPWESDAKTWIFTHVGPQAVELLGYPRER